MCGEDAAEPLAGLAEASLVRRAEDGRYRMLQTIREYAVERLVESGEAEEVRRRHAEYFRELGDELVVALPGDQSTRCTRPSSASTTTSGPRSRSRARPSRSSCDSRLAAAVSHFWLVRGHLAEGRAWLEETLDAASAEDVPPLLRAQVLRKLATLEWRQGDFDIAGERAEAALPLLAGEVDEDERYRLLILLGCIEYSRQNREGSRDWWEQSAALARTLENDAHLALALSNLGVVAAELEDYEGGVAIYEESVESAQRAEHREYLAGALLGLGDMNLRLGRFEAGRAQLTESMALYRRLGFQDRIASCCVWLAPAPEHDGDVALAARLLGAAAGIRRQTGASIDWQEQEFLDALVERLRSSLGDGAYDAAFAAGKRRRTRSSRRCLRQRQPPPQWPVRTCVQAGRRQSPRSPAFGAAGAAGTRTTRAARQATAATASDARIVDCRFIVLLLRAVDSHVDPGRSRTARLPLKPFRIAAGCDEYSGRVSQYDPYTPREAAEPSEPEYSPLKHPLTIREILRKLFAPLIALGLLLIKFGAFAIKFFGIFISVGGYALIWGWKFAVGFVLLILVHELGHYIEATRQGLKPSLPVFVPFLGAYVAMKNAPFDPWRNLLVSAAGPLLGGIGALGVWVAGEANDSRFLVALAYTGFLLNLFNLIPVRPLDGGFMWRSLKALRYGNREHAAWASPARLAGGSLIYTGLVVLLILGMVATHVEQTRL